MIHFSISKHVVIVVIIGAILIASLFYILRKNNFYSDRRGGENLTASLYPEVSELAKKSLSFDELSAYLKQLAQEKSAEYAFGVLSQATLPPNMDLHLLGHIVGDELYKQKGVEGISVCTNEFRNACSHSIVVGLFLEKGEKAVPQITEACRKAPGGPGAYTMCFHGLGHGVLAYTGFDLKRAITLCGNTETHGASQCIGGAVMEIISGGGHNRELWAKMRTQYLMKTDPLAPCKLPNMPSDGRIFCLIYITPYLWEAVGGDMNNPTENDFAGSFAFCNLLLKEDISGRDACFGGFGKEFVTIANNRDIRSVDQMNEAQMRRVYDWCLLAKYTQGIASCVVSAMNALYWGGENNRAGAIRFCRVIPDEYHQRGCMNRLIHAVDVYHSDAAYRESFCKELPRAYVDECIKALIPL